MRKLLLALAFLGLVAPAQAQNYTATQGAGTTFGSKLVTAVNYPQFVVCDPTTPAQCAAVDASGRLSLIPNTAFNIAQINGVTPLMGNGTTGTGSLRITVANDNTIPTGWPTAALQTSGNSSLTTIATNSGTQATAALQTSGNSSLTTIATNSALPLPAQSTHTVNIGAVDSINEYPGTAVPYTASTTGTTAATTATLAGASSVTTYICGMSVRSNATAAATGNITVTGTISATMNFTHWTAPLASGIGITEMIFKPCVPASGTNQSIAVVSPAPGTGGVISVTAWGYKL